MSNARHTPGPWDWNNSPYDDGTNYIKIIIGDDVFTGITSEANAKLIAAAPDMAEALKAMLTYSRFIGLGSAEGYNDAISQARAALAKAGIE